MLVYSCKQNLQGNAYAKPASAQCTFCLFTMTGSANEAQGNDEGQKGLLMTTGV